MAGRPTKYNKDIQKQAEAYLENYKDTHGDEIPSNAGLARILKVHRDTIIEWGKQHPAFSDTLDDIQHEQERKLLNNGLNGKFNSNITKLALHNHGYSDKKELSGPNGGPIQTQSTWELQPVAANGNQSSSS